MASEAPQYDSIFKRRMSLEALIRAGIVDRRVIDELLVDAAPVPDEAVLWDFKLKLPVLPKAIKLSDAEKSRYDCEFAEVIKDVVAFYNSYGGYLIAGIDDAKAIIGFDEDFDAHDLNKRTQGATGISIETVYRKIPIATGAKNLILGLLFIPRRADSEKPTQIKRAAPLSATGKQAFLKDAFYLRERDTCRAAQSSDDYEFLFSPKRRQWSASFSPLSAIDNNLPPRDPELGNFVGREEEVSRLWQWLVDAFSPVKILCGLGGLGKTSIAYSFAERVIYQAPAYIDKVIWLGAKQNMFSSTLNQLRVMPRVDFGDISTLLCALLLEIGCPPDLIPDQPSRDELLDLTENHLKAFSYLIVVDDVDTLENEDQQELFHLLTQLCSTAKAKALITARRNLGAARATYIEIEGLSAEAFHAFINEKAELLKVPITFSQNSSDFNLLYGASGGSPLFALSILRLISLGDSLRDAVQNWRGTDGEKVRDAAFRREVTRLQANEGRVLLVLCYLEQASAIELSAILGLSRYEVQEGIEALQAFSMTSISSNLPGGASFKVPETLRLMNGLIEQRVGDWEHIRKTCQERTSANRNQASIVGQAIVRSLAHLQSGDSDSAVSTAKSALEILPNHPDLVCLLGRCYGQMDSRFLDEAEQAFRRAFELGCRRRELFAGWIAARQRRQDWRGSLEIAELATKTHPIPQFFTAANEARKEMGDMFGRGGRYAEAETTYQEAIDNLEYAIRLETVQGGRAGLRRLRETLALRWLGAIKAGEVKKRGTRVFGACYRAFTQYGIVDPGVMLSGLTSLQDWLANLQSRRNLSETAIEQLGRQHNRLTRLIALLDANSGVAALQDETKRMAKDLAMRCETIVTGMA